MRALADDIRAAVRGLVRQPGYTAVAVLILALGIGANATVFSVLDTIILRELPYRDADRLVLATSRSYDAFVERRHYERWDFEPWPELAESSRFVGVAAAIAGDLTLGGGTAARVRGAAVSRDFFATLGVQPVVGRLFTGADTAATRELAVISERFWLGRLGGARDIVGESLRLNGRSFVVRGVLPRRVQFPGSPDVWIPSGIDSQLGGENPNYAVVVRLRDGVTLSDARAELVRITAEHWPLLSKEARTVRVLPLRDGLAGAVRPVLLLIASCAMIVLLVSCLNIAGLLLIRVSARDRDLAVRRAIGASRWRLARHVVLESLALSVAGAAVAVPAAIWMAAGASRLLPATLHGAADVAVDTRVFGAMAVLLLVTALLSAAAPSMALSHSSWVDTLRGIGPSSAGPVRSRVRNVLVVAQIAAALVLLVGGLTVVRKVADMMAVDLGVRGDHALVLQLELPRTRYRDREARIQYYRQLEEELSRVPGVRDVGSTDYLPGSQTGLPYVLAIHVEGLPRSDTRALDVAATPAYFAAIGLDLLAGRAFRSSDRLDAPRVAVASIGVARALGLRPSDLVGRRIDLSPAMPRPTWAEVIGVVARDIRLGGAEDQAKPTVYVPFEQRPPAWSAYTVVRSHATRQPPISALRAAAARIDPDVPLYNVRTFDEVRAASLADRRLLMMLMLALGGIAILQAAVGLYGMMSHAVQGRTREFGIRIALGASPARVRADVLWNGAAFGGTGIAIGAVASLGLWRLVAAHIANIGEIDLWSITGVGAGIVLVTLAATWLPARRATRVDPVTALRAE